MSNVRITLQSLTAIFVLTVIGLVLLGGCTTIQPVTPTMTIDDAGTRSVEPGLFGEGSPNENGSSDALYVLSGDLAGQNGAESVSGLRSPQLAFEDGDAVTLRIFHFNDLHHHLFTPHRTRGDTHTFSQMVKIVNDTKNAAGEDEIVLFLSAGDDHIGTILDELLGYDAETFTASPAYPAYSAAGVDAAMIGNHELDRGTELLSLAIEQDAAFPVLSANLEGSDYLTEDLISSAVIGLADGLRVGIIGLTTPTETHLYTEMGPHLGAADLMETLTTVLPPVAQHADVIILLNHVGYHGEEAGVAYQQTGCLL